MRSLVVALLAMACMAPVASAAIQQETSAVFPMAQGFDDRMTIVSGSMDLRSEAAKGSSAFFRTSEIAVEGLTRVCWTVAAVVAPQCADGPLTVTVPEGASFGFSSPMAYSVEVETDHALATFVDLSDADGFDDKLHVGPSILASLLDGEVALGSTPTFTADTVGGLALLEEDGRLEVRSAGVLVHTVKPNDSPLTIEGRPRFPPTFEAAVVVVPFAAGSVADFGPAAEADAVAGLAKERIELLDDILQNVDLISAKAKSAPFAILDRAGAFLSEVFNGAYLRTRLADDPNGLGDVGFAKFDELTISDGKDDTLAFDGSYTLVVGDLGPSFDGSAVSDESNALRWWTGIFLLVAVGIVAAWLWMRDGPFQAERGPQTWVARLATAVGVVIAFLVWDWQLKQTLGSSVLTTGAGGSGFGLLLLVQLASLALAGLLIGVPAFFAVRYGLALAKLPKYASLAGTAAVFCTIGFGVLLLPALVAFVAGLAA